MLNLLPDIKKSISNSTNKGLNESWSVKNAHPKTGKISQYLRSEFTEEIQYIKPKYQVNTNPIKEPNERHVVKYFNEDQNHKSPLNSEECGIADVPQIIFSPPKSLTHKTIDYDSGINNCLIVKLINSLPLCMELFVQKKSNITNFTVYPNFQSIRLVSGTAYLENSDVTSFWTTSIKRGTITCTNRQVIKNFKFDSSMQIGLEVELIGDKLKCTNVLNDCQATKYRMELDGAEVIAVNSIRVISMEEFRQAMSTAREHDEIILQVAAFLDERGKQDAINFLEFSKKKNVKSLLSNIMLNGLDQEHQHGLLDLKEEKEDGSSSSSSDEDESKHRSHSSHHSQSKKNSTSCGTVGEFEEDQMEAQGWSHLEQYDDVIEDDEHLGMKAIPKQKKSLQLDIKETTTTAADDDATSIDSDFSNNSWAITKKNEVYNLTTIVCVPKNMSRSQEWGNPKKYLQVSNHSNTWQVEMFWIDEDGVLISKGHIKPHTTQFQLCSEQHIWALVATSTLKSGGTIINTQKDYTDLSINSDDRGAGSVSVAQSEYLYPVMLVFKPTASSLTNNKCTSVLWTPLSSVSITQRVYSSSNKSRSTSVYKQSTSIVSTNIETVLLPNMHIQIFDGINKGIPDHTNTTGNATDNHPNHQITTNLNEYKIDKIKLKKWPNRKLRK